MPPSASYANAEGSAVLLVEDDGTRWATGPADARLAGLAIAPFSAPAPVPPTVRLLQFLGQGVAQGIFTEDEALAAARTGAVPAAVESVFASLPAGQQFQARLAWAAMYEVDRSSPLLVAVAAAQGMDGAAMDQFFRDASRL